MTLTIPVPVTTFNDADSGRNNRRERMASSGGPPTSSVVNPLCIILVKNGSKGDRLLFRYPYKGNDPSSPLKDSPPPRASSFTSSFEIPQPRSSHVSDLLLSSSPTPTPTVSTPTVTHPSPELPATPTESPIKLSPPPAASATEGTRRSNSTATSSTSSSNDGGGPLLDTQQLRLRKISSLCSPASLFSIGEKTSSINSRAGVLRSPYVLDKSGASDVFTLDGGNPLGKEIPKGRMSRFSPGENEMLRELSDKDLSNLLAVGTDLSERKFELKLNYVRFVGHPTLMHNPNEVRPMNPMFQTSVRLFHIVFCLEAVASHSIVKCFHDLSKRLGIALRHEEYRCGFLNKEMKTIIALHDEACTTAQDEENKDEDEKVKTKMFDEILAKSKLAQLLKRVFDDVTSKGCTFIRVNNWVQISFCLPQKIHTLPFRTQAPLVEPEAIHRCLEAIRPYHAILLLVDVEELTESLWLDASSTMPRVLQVYSPLKSLQTLAADADLTLSHVVEIASHLVYWAQAIVIYPLCETNVYALAPDCPITSEKLRSTFEEKFPGVSLTETLAQFSIPMPLGDRMNPVTYARSQLSQHVNIVTWFLKHRLLVHLHTYIYLTTYFDGYLLETGVDFLTSLSGDPDGSARFNSHIRPYEIDEDDATASDTFSETTTADELAGGSGMINHRDPSEVPGPSSSSPIIAGSSRRASDLPFHADSRIIGEEKIEDDDGDDSAAKFKAATSELSDAVKRAVNIVKNALTVQDIKMFSRLSRYFTGDFHMEEIMYRENVRRSQLMLLLDKFRDVLVTVEKEDAEINFFKF